MSLYFHVILYTMKTRLFKYTENFTTIQIKKF